MFPRLLLLFAFIVISFKSFHIIYIKVFKLELCNDDFYTGGIKDSIPNVKLLRRSVSSQKSCNSRREGAIRPAVSYKTSSTSKSNINYSSYESYKKIKV